MKKFLIIVLITIGFFSIVLAQQDTATTNCDSDVITEYMETEFGNVYLQMVLDETSISSLDLDTIDGLQQDYWLTIFPEIPKCEPLSEASMLIGHGLDELLIMKALEAIDKDLQGHIDMFEGIASDLSDLDLFSAIVIPTNAPRPTSLPSGTTYYIKSNSANLRAEPNTSSSVVGGLSWGNEIQVIDNNVQGQSVSGSTRWYELNYKGDIAYVHSSLISRTPPPTAAPQARSNNTSSSTTNLGNQSQPTAIPQAPTFSCNCSKTCSAMTSCEEAYFQLNQCGCSKRDGDGDGVPCESICPGG